MDTLKPARSPEVVTRKAVAGERSSQSKLDKVINLMKEFEENKSSGRLMLTFQDGGIRSSTLELINPV